MSIRPAYPVAAAGEIVDDSLTRSAYADPEGMPFARRAAKAGNWYAIVGFGPKTSAATFRWKHIWDTAPTVTTGIWGRSGSGRIKAIVTSSGDLRFEETGTVIASYPGGILFDGLPHSYELVLGVNTQEFFRDGVSLGAQAGTFSYLVDTPSTHYIGKSDAGEPDADRGVMWDFEFVDPVDTTETAVYPLEALDADGAFPNTHPGSVIDRAAVVGEVSFVEIASTTPGAELLAIPATGVERRHIQDPAGMATVRRGAYFNGVAGPAIAATWAPSGSNRGLEFSTTMELPPVVTAQPVGRTAADHFDVRFETNGNIRVLSSATELAEFVGVTVGVTAPSRWRVDITATSVALWRNGELLETVTGLSITFTSTPSTYYIGAANTTNRMVNGALYDVVLRDDDDDTNTAFYPLDGQKSGGGYENTHPGSTVADATVFGAVIDVAVNSLGPGKPLHAGGPLVCALSRTTALSRTVDGALSVDTAMDDVMGMLSGVTVTLPVAGSVRVLFTGRVRATVLSGAIDAEMVVNKNGVPFFRQAITLDTTDEWVPFAICGSMGAWVAGDNTYTSVGGVTGSGATIEYDDCYFTVSLYPSGN